ncbi:hypothetical protein VKT23_015953 [Stygiomarasmius scandens]|uniref:F-box domain-containing protein n=1 Tax=Marasmiellus scandens TaxID=2682957 RepID=A0ABR1IYV5_9AGAR
MVSTDFPLELCAEIMGHCNPESLKSCILVCRDWFPFARPHLFHDFSFPPENQLKQFKDDDDEIIREKLERFIDDMNASTLLPSLSTIVRRLRINTGCFTYPHKVPAFYSELPFKGLTHIRLQAITFDNVAQESFCKLLERQPSMESLIFDHGYYDRSDGDILNFYRALSSAKCLHTLGIPADEQFTGDLDTLPESENPPRLQALRFSLDQAKWIRKLVSSHLFNTASLRKLVVTLGSVEDFNSCFQAIGNRCGSAITSLSLEFAFEFKSLLPEDLTVFDNFVNLTHFSIKLWLLFRDWDDSVCDLFKSLLLRLQGLQNLTIAPGDYGGFYRDFPYFFDESFDSFLSTLPGTSPRLETINLNVPADEMVLAETLAGCLPKTQERGLLKICVGHNFGPFELQRSS